MDARRVWLGCRDVLFALSLSRLAAFLWCAIGVLVICSVDCTPVILFPVLKSKPTHPNDIVNVTLTLGSRQLETPAIFDQDRLNDLVIPYDMAVALGVKPIDMHKRRGVYGASWFELQAWIIFEPIMLSVKMGSGLSEVVREVPVTTLAVKKKNQHVLLGAVTLARLALRAPVKDGEMFVFEDDDVPIHVH
eukprot:EG_transcript_20194